MIIEASFEKYFQSFALKNRSLYHKCYYLVLIIRVSGPYKWKIFWGATKFLISNRLKQLEKLNICRREVMQISISK